MFTILAFWEENVFLHCLWLMSQKKMYLSQELTLEILSFQQQHKNDKVSGIRKYLNSTYILRILVGPWYEIFHTSFICIISDLNLSTKGLKTLLPVTSAQLFLINHNEIRRILRSKKWHSTLFFSSTLLLCAAQLKHFKLSAFLQVIPAYYAEKELKNFIFLSPCGTSGKVFLLC